MTGKNSGGDWTEIEEVFPLVCKVVGVCKVVPVHCGKLFSCQTGACGWKTLLY